MKIKFNAPTIVKVQYPGANSLFEDFITKNYIYDGVIQLNEHANGVEIVFDNKISFVDVPYGSFSVSKTEWVAVLGYGVSQL